MFCSACGRQNADGAAHCVQCGAPLAPSGVAHDPYAVSPSVARMESVAAAGSDPVRAFIGPKNQAYYVGRFAAIEAKGGRLVAGWHWPAFFVTFYWMLYRKMWLAALGYFFLPTIVGSVIGALIGITGSSTLQAVYGFVFPLAMLVLPPMYATSLYYKKYASVLAKGDPGESRERTLGRLEAKGGTSGLIIVVLGVIAFVFVIGILAAVALPAYSDYSRRARGASITDAGADLRPGTYAQSAAGRA